MGAGCCKTTTAAEDATAPGESRQVHVKTAGIDDAPLATPKGSKAPSPKGAAAASTAERQALVGTQAGAAQSAAHASANAPGGPGQQAPRQASLPVPDTPLAPAQPAQEEPPDKSIEVEERAVPRRGGAEGSPQRMYSFRSEAALGQLSQLGERLASLEVRVDELGNMVTSVREGGGAQQAAELGQIKTELAQLEAEAHKLESNGVDNVYTGELNSGKVPAKDTKKFYLQRLEALFNKIEQTFKVISED